MSYESMEREAALAASRRTAEALGLCMYRLVGSDALVALWLALGSLSQRAMRRPNEFVVIDPKNHEQVAAVHILCAAGLFRQCGSHENEFAATDAGIAVAKQVFRK